MDDEWYDEAEAEEERIRRERRAKRMAEMRRSKRRQKMLRRLLVRAIPLLLAAIALIVLLVIGIRRLVAQPKNEKTEQTEMTDAEAALSSEGDAGIDTANMEAASMGVQAGPMADALSDNSIENDNAADNKNYAAQATDDTRPLGEDVISSQAILVDRETDTILAQRDAMSRINPASMTKILTVLVAAEHVTDLDDTFTVTIDITDYSYENDCSAVGFAENETVTVRDLWQARRKLL